MGASSRPGTDGGGAVLERVAGAVELSAQAEQEIGHKASLALLKGEVSQLDLIVSPLLKEWQAAQLKERIKRAIDAALASEPDPQAVRPSVMEALQSLGRRALASVALQDGSRDLKDDEASPLERLINEAARLALLEWREIEAELRTSIESALLPLQQANLSAEDPAESIFGEMYTAACHPLL